MPESQDAAMPKTYPAGVPCWIDLETDDVAAAQAFYGSVFGWEFVEVSPDPVYVIARLDGEDVAGLGAVTEGTAGGWSTYIAVDDAEAAAGVVEAAGGRVVVPPLQAGPGGRLVACVDPAGVPFRLWEAHRRLGAQAVNLPNSWNFSDLHAVDPAASIAFYAQVFGWETDDVGFGSMVRRPGYGDHLAATTYPDIHEVQAAVSAPTGFADAVAWLAPAAPTETPSWHVTFAVAERDAAVAAVERLGGTVLSVEDTQWTRQAQVRDPLGHVLTLSQFTPPERG